MCDGGWKWDPGSCRDRWDHPDGRMERVRTGFVESSELDRARAELETLGRNSRKQRRALVDDTLSLKYRARKPG